MTSQDCTDRSPNQWDQIQKYLEILDDRRKAIRNVEIEPSESEDEDSYGQFLQERNQRLSKHVRCLESFNAALANPYDCPLDEWDETERSIVRSLPTLEERLAHVTIKTSQPSETLLRMASDLMAWFNHIRTSLVADGLVDGLFAKVSASTEEFTLTRKSIYKSRPYQILRHLNDQYRLFEWLLRPKGRMFTYCGMEASPHMPLQFRNAKKLQEEVSRQIGCDPRTIPEIKQMRYIVDKMYRTLPQEQERRKKADAKRKREARATGTVVDSTAAERQKKYREKKKLDKLAAARSAALDAFMVEVSS